MRFLKLVSICLLSFSLAACAQNSVTLSPNTVIVDTRDAKNYAEGNLSGSVLMDLRSGDFETRVSNLDPKLTYAIYCATQECATEAAEIFTKLGFKNVINLGSLDDAVSKTGISINSLTQ